MDNTPKDTHPLATEHNLAKIWKDIAHTKSEARVIPSIEEVLTEIKKMSDMNDDIDKIDLLVTGSLHLVGGFMEVAQIDAS